MAILVGCLLTAIVVGGLVYGLQARRQVAFKVEADAAREKAAVAEARLSDFSMRHSALDEAFQQERVERRAVDAERERLSGQMQVAMAERAGVQKECDESKAVRTTLEAERQALQGQVAEVRAVLAARDTENSNLINELDRQKLWIEEQTKHFSEQVLATAAKLMEERGKVFTEAHTKELQTLVAPFKEKLDEFRRRVDEIHTQDTNARGQLDEKIVSLTSLNRSVSDQAERLVKALTVSSKSVGNWGETILSKILEDSGLREGRDYKLQLTIKGANGEDLRPDAILYLPDDRQLVVDSKVSNKAWTEYCAATTDEEREQRLKDHLTSLRTHIKGLATKDYARSPDLKTVDFVLMFVPVEAALLTALVKDEDLYGNAYAQRIILVTPTTLMAVVRMALGLWTFQTRMESVEAIVEVGRKLYDKFVNFAESFVDVGNAIKDSQDAFEKAQGQLSTGRGNAVRLAEQLKELGVTPSAGKGVPASLLSTDRPNQAEATSS